MFILNAQHCGCHRQPNDKCDCEHCKAFLQTANVVATTTTAQDNWPEPVANTGWKPEPLGLPELDFSDIVNDNHR